MPVSMRSVSSCRRRRGKSIRIRREGLMARLPPWVASVVVTRQPAPAFCQRSLLNLRRTGGKPIVATCDGQSYRPGTCALPVIREGEDDRRSAGVVRL